MTPPMPASFRALHLADDPIAAGCLPLEVADLLLENGLVGQAADRLVLEPGDNLSSRLEDIRDLLARRGLIGPVRGEAMPVRVTFDGPMLATVDRSAMRILGLWATKIHVNGLVRDAGGLSLWLSRRAATSAAEPGAFDTLVAGGRSARETELETAHKEGREEAGLSARHLARLRPVRRLPVQYVSELGFHQELLAIYDLDLDGGFEPRCADGEIDHHIRIGVDILRDEPAVFRLKRSSAIVCADLVKRLGTPGTEVRPAPGRGRRRGAPSAG